MPRPPARALTPKEKVYEELRAHRNSLKDTVAILASLEDGQIIPKNGLTQATGAIGSAINALKSVMIDLDD